MDILNEQFGVRLRHIRMLNNLSQKELAAKTNISNQVLSNLERGYTKTISYQDLKQLTQELNCSIGDLIPESDRHSIPDASEIDIVSYLSNAIDMLDTYTNIKIDGNSITYEEREALKIMIQSTIDVSRIRNNKSKKINNSDVK